MKRRKSSAAYRKERIIMIASSVLVLTAMTVTGISIYQSGQTQEGENIVDFSALEDGAPEKGDQITQAQNNSAQNLTSGQGDGGELDYDPYYAEKDRQLNGQEGETETAADRPREQEDTAADQAAEPASGLSGRKEETEEPPQESAETQEAGQAEGQESTAAEESAQEVVADAIWEEGNLHFDDTAKLQWPIVGNVVLDFSMDKTVYFQTLQQYKYNPSIVIGATQGTNVACAADGIVKSVYQDPQTGTTVVMNLGDGYELTYGQLTDIMVEEGEYVETGVYIGKVAAPTKYYAKEGTNVYFKLTKDAQPVDPLSYLG